MGELHFAVIPLAFVYELTFDLAHAGVGLGLGSTSAYHARDVEVLDDEVLELVDQLEGHLMLRVAAETGDTAVQIVDAALSFPPASAAVGAAGLGPLPAAELVFGLVVRLGVLPSLSIAVAGVRVDAGVDSAVGNAGLGLWRWLGWLPHLDADDPAAVQELDVRFVDDALAQCVQ